MKGNSIYFSLPNGKQSWMGPIQGREKGRHQQTGAVYGFPQAVISKPTSGIRPQSAEQTDSRVMLMMHVPKNAELFLYEQLCRRSQLTQCSASPPFELWAKLELRRHQEWRKGPGSSLPWPIWGSILDCSGMGEDGVKFLPLPHGHRHPLLLSINGMERRGRIWGRGGQ